MKYLDFKKQILLEDDDFIILNKPPFISSVDEHDGTRISVLSIARSINPDYNVCHRLDKETSGALVLSKNKDAYRHLSIQFENQKVKKTYHALVAGFHQFSNTHVNLPLTKLTNGKIKIDLFNGKPSETYFNTLCNYKKCTLVECLPMTGRMHQVRIHLSSLNASVVGDEIYGGKHLFLSEFKRDYNFKRDEDETPMIKRFALHAHKISFVTLNNTEINIEAPYPKDFRALIRVLDKYAKNNNTI